MEEMKLYMVLIGCKPPGRFTEQHDIFFGIAASLRDLVPAIKTSWAEAPKIHIDAWREVTETDGYTIKVIAKERAAVSENRLFFLNLGGYKETEFEEYHYKMLVAAADKGAAVQCAKQTAFYKHTGFTGATSHIDDKYGVDVDDLYEIADILPAPTKEKYTLVVLPGSGITIDEWHLGYLPLSRLEEIEK